MKPIILTKDKLLHFVKNHIPKNPVIVEAGAFNGADTRKLSAQWPHATIHAFEPVPDIYALLKQNINDLPNVSAHNVALSSSTGTALLHVSENPTKPGKPFPAASLHAPKERLKWSNARYTNTIQVPTVTLDEWATANGVTHIDFLWLDLQGHELAVMKAAPTILANTRLIYVEVNFVEAYEGQPLYPEVKEWLEAQGFVVIAQDFTDTTSWFFGNLLCIKAQ